MEIILNENEKFIQWSELSNKIIDDVRYNDSHEIYISNNIIQYTVYNSVGHIIKKIIGNQIIA